MPTNSPSSPTGSAGAGALEVDGGGNSNGTITVSDSGQLILPITYIGTAGVLNGNGGTIVGDLFIDGGAVTPGS